LNKRSNRNQKDNLNSKEPWDQPIYDSESSKSYSRSSQHRQKRGNTLFLSVVLFILFLCVAIPTVVGIWVVQQKNEAASAISSTASSQTTQTSVTATTTSASESTSSSASETTESSTAASSSTDSASSSTTSESQDTSSSTSEASGDTITVLSGEGPNQIAARAGISVDKLLELNGMTLQNYFFSPGQKVKIK